VLISWSDGLWLFRQLINLRFRDRRDRAPTNFLAWSPLGSRRTVWSAIACPFCFDHVQEWRMRRHQAFMATSSTVRFNFRSLIGRFLCQLGEPRPYPCRRRADLPCKSPAGVTRGVTVGGCRPIERASPEGYQYCGLQGERIAPGAWGLAASVLLNPRASGTATAQSAANRRDDPDSPRLTTAGALERLALLWS
jgi:hypothetical protein